jgi:hypothetical protein
MSQLRGCDSFEDLYDRRTTIEDPETDAVYTVPSRVRTATPMSG